MRYGLVLVLAACGSSPHSTPDAAHAPDAPPDTPAVGPNVVTVTIVGAPTPDLIAYRDGSGPWQTPAAAGTSMYTLHVTDDYRVLAVCVDPMLGPDVEMIAQTFSGDGAQATIFCGIAPSTTPTFVAVTGTMNQAGQITLGDSAMSTTAPWNFNLSVATGMHDLIAISTANKIEVQRGIAVSQAMQLPTVDLTNAASLLTTTPTLAGVGGSETVITETLFLTANEFVTIDRAMGATAHYVPASLVQSADFHRVHTTASAAMASHEVSYAPPAPATLTLLPNLTGTTFGANGSDAEVTLGTLPAYELLELAVSATNTNAFELIDATQSWVAKTGATKLALETDAPGFQAAWRVDLTMAHVTSLEAFHSAAGVNYFETISDVVNFAPPPRLRAHRMRSMR